MTAFVLGGQRGWVHDEGHRAGIFHTYDHLSVGRRRGPRKVHVFLPRGAGALGERYPVIYFHDGDTTFWRGGVAYKSWHVAETLSDLAAGAARPATAGRPEASGAKRSADEVSPEGRAADVAHMSGPVIAVALHSGDRNAEYTHVDWSSGRRSWGALRDYSHDLAVDIKGFIDAHYPTLPEARHTAVVGSSHGGLAAFWCATRHPEAVGLAGCFSPSLFSGLDTMAGVRGHVPLMDAPIVADVVDLLGDRARRPRLWLDWGGVRDGGDHNRIVEALAAERSVELRDLLVGRFGYRHQAWDGRPLADGVDLVTAFDPAAGHEEGAWQRRFAWFARAFF